MPLKAVKFKAGFFTFDVYSITKKFETKMLHKLIRKWNKAGLN